jgi:hypothetical protein
VLTAGAGVHAVLAERRYWMRAYDLESRPRYVKKNYGHLMRKPRLADLKAALIAALVAFVVVMAVLYLTPTQHMERRLGVLAVFLTGCGVLYSRLQRR